jgi:hypothetical protein
MPLATERTVEEKKMETFEDRNDIINIQSFDKNDLLINFDLDQNNLQI